MNGCPLCGRSDPHSHDLGMVLNSRHYCPDNYPHNWTSRRRWFRLRDQCTHCGEWRRL